MLRAAKKAFFSFLFVFLSIVPLSGQSLKFAVITDTHIGSEESASAELEAIVRLINRRQGLAFAVVTGDITEKGRSVEFREAKKILDGLTVPYHVIPGNHDCHWIGHGLTNFRNAWGDDRFLFQKGDSVFVGLNAWDSGHLAPEDLAWLEKTLGNAPPEGKDPLRRPERLRLSNR